MEGCPDDLRARERVELVRAPDGLEPVDGPREVVEMAVVDSSSNERDRPVVGRVQDVVGSRHLLGELNEGLNDRGEVVLHAWDGPKGREVGVGVVGGEA